MYSYTSVFVTLQHSMESDRVEMIENPNSAIKVNRLDAKSRALVYKLTE